MHLILYVASTLNGMIAKKDGNSEWVSPEDIASFTHICKQTHVAIMGRKTYELLAPDDLPVPEGLEIVMTSNPGSYTNTDNLIFTDKSPKEVVCLLEEKGYDSAVVFGPTSLRGN